MSLDRYGGPARSLPSPSPSGSSSCRSHASSSSSTSGLYLLFEKLHNPEDPEFSCPLLEFLQESQLLSCGGATGSGLAGAEAVALDPLECSVTFCAGLAERTESLKREQQDLCAELEVQRHAREKLLLELRRAEAAIEAIQRKEKAVALKIRYATTALAKLASQEGDRCLATLSSPGASEAAKVEAVLALLRSTPREELLSRALQQLESFCVQSVEDPLPSSLLSLWAELLP
eukprot:RCo004858